MTNDHPTITIEHAVVDSFIATDRALRCAAMFGLDEVVQRPDGTGPERMRTLIARTAVPLAPGSVVFITGPSGGGKSTMLRAIAREAGRCGHRVIVSAALPPPPDAPLVDCLDCDTLPEAMATLARAGLAEARVFLRTPDQLSDGQRARFELARIMHESSKHAPPALCLIDEFASTLDRFTAFALALQVRRWAARTEHIAILASAHEDLIAPLEPDVLVHVGLDSDVEVLIRDAR